MKKLKQILRTISDRVCTVDKFLILFMLILFVYMVVNLPFGTDSSSDNSKIDVIIRTSMAAIFGYFMSGNFMKNRSEPPDSRIETRNIEIYGDAVETGQGRIKNLIGFQAAGNEASVEKGGTPEIEEEIQRAGRCNKMQVTVVSIIGILSLAVLFIARHFQNVTPELTATVSQLRDFVSACIGFLISCGKDAER